MVTNKVLNPVNINERNSRIIPFEFEYYEPRTLEEAVDILHELGDEAKVIAGGTDLLVKMKTGQVHPRVVVNIKKIPGLRYIREEGDYIRIGALTTLRDLEKHEVVMRHLPALYDAVKKMASIQVRTVATLAGNLCNASPAADTAPPLLVYDPVIVAVGPSGERQIPLREFFLGPGKTVLKPWEIVKEVVIPKAKSGYSAFVKISRTSVDIAIASSAVYLDVKEDVISEARIAVGSVAPVPLRAVKTETRLRGLRMGSTEVMIALQGLDEEISPITDVRATAEYRRHVAKVLVWDALHLAYSRYRERVINQ